MKLWNELSMKEKHDIIRESVSKGIHSLDDIKAYYDNYYKDDIHLFLEGGERNYQTWKSLIAKYKGLDIDNDNTYDYEGYYNAYPNEAWAMLNDNPEAHFTDEFKTVYHPTFSNESSYSGKVNMLFNPYGKLGGIWTAGDVFIPAYNLPWSNKYKEGGPEEVYTPSPNETDKIKWFEHWYNNREKQLADNYRKADTYLSAGDLIRKLLPNNVTDSYFAQKAKNHLLQNINSVSEGVLPTTRGQGNLTDNQYKVAQESLKQYVSDLTPEDYDKVHLLNVLQRGEYTPSAHTILYAPDAKAPTIIHERTHASNPKFIENYIGNNSQTRLRKGIEKDYYLDSANEVYGRLNAFRYKNNLDPTEVITPEKLEYLKKNAKDYNLLNRYDDDTLLFLFNDVAYNPIEQYDTPNITAFGGPLVKLANRFLEGGDKDDGTTPIYTPFLNDTPIQAVMRQLNVDYSKPENRAMTYNVTHPVSPSNGGFIANSDGTFTKVNPNPAIRTMAKPAAEVASYVPVIGDAMYAGEVYDAAKQGNYGTAAALAGLALLPNALESPVKKVIKKTGLLDDATAATEQNLERYYRGSRKRNSISSDEYSSDFFTDTKDAAKGYGNYVTEVEIPSNKILTVDAKGNRWDLLGGREYRKSGSEVDIKAYQDAKDAYEKYVDSTLEKYGVPITEENRNILKGLFDDVYNDVPVYNQNIKKLGLDPEALEYGDYDSWDFISVPFKLKNNIKEAAEAIKEIPVDIPLEVPGLGRFTNIDAIGTALSEKIDFPYDGIKVLNVSDAADIGKGGFGTHSQLVYRKNAPRKQTGLFEYSHGGPLVHAANRYDGETEPTLQMYRMKVTPNTVRFKDISFDPTGATYNLPEYVVTPQSNPDNGSRRVITLDEMAQQAAMNKAINEGMNRAGNIGAATMATSLAPALWSTVLSSGAFNWVTNPYIRVGLDTIGSVDSAKNLLSQQGILKTYNKFKENNYLGGIKSGAGDLLDIAGTGDLLKIIRRFNKNNRALHAYNVISPYSYEKPFKRGLTWFEDIVNNTPVNIDSPKWKIDPKTEDYINKIAESIRPITYPNAQIEDVKKIVSETREDAWRMYNGLPLKYNSYISNGDGTFSYNMNKIINDSKNSYNRVHGNSRIDDITSAGGGLSSTVYPISSNLGIREIMDVWDLHPFIRQSDKLSRRLLNISDEIISKGANNLYTSLFDKLYRYRFPYLYLGGLLLNRLRYTPPQFTDNKIFKYLDDKFSELEAGKIIGGTPFTMRTEIPYTTNVESFLKDLDVNSSAVLREKYGLSPNVTSLNVDNLEKERLQAYNKGGLQELIKVINKQDLIGSNFKIDPTIFLNITDISRGTKNTTKFAEGGPKGKRFVDVLGNVVSAFGITPKYPDTMPTLWSEVLPEESYTELPTMTANLIEGKVAPLPNNNEDFIPDFTNIKTKDNFGYNIDNLTTAYHYFKDNMKLNDYLIASLLANGIAESGFDPKAHNPKTSAKGLYLWLDGRYKYSSNKMSNTELLNELLQYINDTLNNTEDLMSWHHGGDGSGYNKAVEAHDRFYNAKNLYDAVHSFTYGYNRPDNVALRVKQRYDLALKILERLLAKLHKDGGKIYIKPENRGKFTALKKRTGHSASWFKAHGTPALRKMATFALNAKKWKHDDGGYTDIPNLLLPPTKENLIYSGHKSWYNK